MRRRRPLGRRLLGVLALLVLLELSLQVAAPLVRRAMLRRPPAVAGSAPLTILCVGDSNTYGLYVPAFSYPDQLRERLAARFSAPVRVENRGVPGQASGQVADALPGDLAEVRPDLVLLLAGANDAWNPGGAAGGTPWWMHLRLVRWTAVLLAGVVTDSRFRVDTDAQGEVVVDRGDGPVRVNTAGGGAAAREGTELAASLRTGLGRAIDECRERGAVPILMTYAECEHPVYRQINSIVRSLARERGLLLVDHEPAFAAAIAHEGREALMFNDQHPNARGYALMARGIDAALVQAGWVPPAPLPGESPGGAARERTPPPIAPVLQVAGDGELLLRGPPGWAYQVAVSRAPAGAAPDATGPGFRVGFVRVPVAQDDVLAQAQLEPSLSGRLDASGDGRARLPRRLIELAGGAPLQACLVLLYPPADDGLPPVAAASQPVAVGF